MSSRIASFASFDPRPGSRVLAVAALASLAVHIVLLQSTIRLPDRIEESPPLLATITELPPPPAPVATPSPVKPKHRRVVRAARKVLEEAAGLDAQLDPVGLVQRRRGGGAAAVDGVQVEGGRAEVGRRLRAGRHAQR